MDNIEKDKFKKRLIDSFFEQPATGLSGIEMPDLSYPILSGLGLLDLSEDILSLSIQYARTELLEQDLPEMMKQVKNNPIATYQLQMAKKQLDKKWFVAPILHHLYQTRFRAAHIFLSKPLYCFGLFGS